MQSFLKNLKIKNALVGSIFILFVSMIGTFYTAQAQCPPGYTFHSFTIIDPISGCSWQVDMCYKCGVTGGDPTNVTVLNVKPLTGCPPPDQDFLISQIRIKYGTLCTIPPCEESCLDMVVNLPLCQRWYTIGWFNENNEFRWRNIIQTCYEGGYCQIITKVCIKDGDIILCPTALPPNPSFTSYSVTCPEITIPDPGPPSTQFEGIQPRSECWKEYDCE